MALRRQNLSPTANLLRNSRLFSLPNPLPPPSVSSTFGSANKTSDTATLPYPTHQAIATTPSSLSRGDWGLKRPLPARSRILQTSNPVVRIKQWDTIEHVTDFDSASDHVRTREKFLEMAVPVLRGMSHFNEKDLSAPPPKSAFEKDADVTSYDVEDGLDGAGIALQVLRQSFDMSKKAPKDASQKTWLPNLRWKHDGPWLPGLAAEEFNSYITNELSKRRQEFNQYLENFVKAQIYARRSSAAKEAGALPLDPEAAEKMRAAQEKEWSTFTPEDITAGIRALREKCAADPLNSDLVQKLIIPFLRLPPMKLKSTMYAQAGIDIIDNQKFADETTPNSTHPSAGLGYLRTKAYIANHPILGPQEWPSPITARVVQARRTRSVTQARAKLGVAGFVADDEFRSTPVGYNSGNSVEDLGVLDVETEGGRKVHVQPLFAAVDPSGKIHIKVRRSHGAELQVARGQLEDRPPERKNVDRNPLASLKLGGSGNRGPDNAQDEQMEGFFELMKEAEKNGQFNGERSSR
ncbi:uncharacterized protein EI97DRAFT_434113 [Westerdykella ornata]|uniref:Uncharacterized protein n=1 Tax=Westerdykella ornata TaxID=318751 RepID=A0A6A6JHK1_WESOR|nr:uncharacterized protein EI97DRAFT_434113 [Westerdykella ornata]KAF2275695.1 hypothetical protein EI97DRAFT_434113 [Westerdykella ornata]